jgi:hypothetical protein
VWAPEPVVSPRVAALPDRGTEAVPPEIPNWDRASDPAPWSDTRWEHAGTTTRPPWTVHAEGAAQRSPIHRSRAFTITVVLACLLVVFAIVTVTVVLLHRSADAPTGSTTATAVYPGAARLQTATHAMNAETNTTRTKLHALPGIPTTTRVAALINPYVSNLQHYQTVMSGIEVPPRARTAASNVRALVSRDVRYLGTINGLPPLRLGTYLEEFSTGAAQLQKDLATLQHELRAATA